MVLSLWAIVEHMSTGADPGGGGGGGGGGVD